MAIHTTPGGAPSDARSSAGRRKGMDCHAPAGLAMTGNCGAEPWIATPPPLVITRAARPAAIHATPGAGTARIPGKCPASQKHGLPRPFGARNDGGNYCAESMDCHAPSGLAMTGQIAAPSRGLPRRPRSSSRGPRGPWRSMRRRGRHGPSHWPLMPSSPAPPSRYHRRSSRSHRNRSHRTSRGGDGIW